MVRTEETEYGHLGKIGTTRNNQVHVGELDLVNGTLLGWESADLVRRDNDILALLFLARGCSTCRSISAVNLGTGTAFTDHPALRSILGTADIPDADSTISTTRDKDCRFNTPAEGPNTAIAVAPHALQKPAWGEIPQEDRASIICRRQDLAITTALHGGHVARVATEHTDRISGGDSPHPYGLVGASCEDVGGIWMEADTIHILVMSSEDALLADVASEPKATSAVRTAGDEVMTEWAPSNVPDGAIVTLVDNEALPGVQRPQANCLVPRGGEEQPSIGRNGVLARDVFVRGRTRWESNRVDWGRVTDEAPRVGGRKIVKVREGCFDILPVKTPNSDVRSGESCSNKLVVIREVEAVDTNKCQQIL